MYIVEINVYVLCFPSPSAQRSVLSLACDAMAVYARECPTEPRGLNLAAIYAEEGSLFNTSQRLLESALESVKGDYFFHYFLLGIYHVANMFVNFNILRCKHACSYQTENVSLICKNIALNIQKQFLFLLRQNAGEKHRERKTIHAAVEEYRVLGNIFCNDFQFYCI